MWVMFNKETICGANIKIALRLINVSVHSYYSSCVWVVKAGPDSLDYDVQDGKAPTHIQRK